MIELSNVFISVLDISDENRYDLPDVFIEHISGIRLV